MGAVRRVLLLDDARELPPDTPVLRADDLGVVRGEAVFETLRVLDGRPCLLAEHLTRFAHSAARLGIDLPAGFDELAHKAAIGAEDAGLRLTMTKGGVGFAVLFDVAPETVAGRGGISVVTLPLGIASDLRAQQPWLLGGVKSTSYAVNMAALRHARALGADDAIWVSTDGYVLEAPTSTVIALVDGQLVTPPVDTGILPGTTLLACSRLLPITAAPLSVSDLARATEIALLSSVRGVAPVLSLDGRPLGASPVLTALATRFETTLPTWM
ncbi:MAG: aminotransferase class [Frankiales bacterium]|nr:aminotransferase class [Frankiales bacterium]